MLCWLGVGFRFLIREPRPREPAGEMDRLWYLIPIALVLVLIIWGPSRLPEIGSGMGRAIREFRSAISGARDAVNVDPLGTASAPPAAQGAPPVAYAGPSTAYPAPGVPGMASAPLDLVSEHPQATVPDDGHRG